MYTKQQVNMCLKLEWSCSVAEHSENNVCISMAQMASTYMSCRFQWTSCLTSRRKKFDGNSMHYYEI